jgi:hypothetical protein
MPHASKGFQADNLCAYRALYTATIKESNKYIQHEEAHRWMNRPS